MIFDARIRVTIPNETSSLRPHKLPNYMEQYNRVIDYIGKYRMTDADLIKQMRDSGVSRAFLHAEREFPEEEPKQLNEHVAELQHQHPDLFLGFATVDPFDIRDAMTELRRAYDMGLRGLSLQPSFLDIEPNDRRLYPLYAEAEMLGIPVALHTGINYSRKHPIQYDDPKYLDLIACDFPNLILIACHAGWPWVPQLVAIARKHPTIYLELGAIAPKYLATPGSGWETLLHFGQNLLETQILFGTDWPMMTFDRAIDELSSLPIKESSKKAWLWENGNSLWEKLSK